MSFRNKLKSFFTDEEYEYEYADDNADDDIPGDESPTGSDRKNVVNLTEMRHSTSKVVLYEPRTYEEAQEIADNILNRRTVVINLQQVDHTQKKRIVDFLSGSVYALQGDIQKIDKETFLCTPENVDITGSISDTFISDDEFGRGW